MIVLANKETTPEHAARIGASDLKYVERELDSIQSAAHRLFEHLDQLELPHA